jgi:hypothetical protein
LNCFEIGGGEGLFVAEKNTQKKVEIEEGERRVELQVIN